MSSHLFSVRPRRISCLLSLLAMAMGPAAVARAQSSTLVQIAPFSFSVSGNASSAGGTNVNVPISAQGDFSATFTPFDPALGILQSVTVAWHVVTTASVTGTGIAGLSVGTNGPGNLTLGGVTYTGTGGGGGGLDSGTMTINQSSTLTEPGAVSFDLVSGVSPVVAAFVSGTNIHFNPFSGSQDYVASTTASATLTYTYAAAIPEPSTYALITGLALFGFVIVRGRNSRKA